MYYSPSLSSPRLTKCLPKARFEPFCGWSASHLRKSLSLVYPFVPLQAFFCIEASFAARQAPLAYITTLPYYFYGGEPVYHIIIQSLCTQEVIKVETKKQQRGCRKLTQPWWLGPALEIRRSALLKSKRRSMSVDKNLNLQAMKEAREAFWMALTACLEQGPLQMIELNDYVKGNWRECLAVSRLPRVINIAMKVVLNDIENLTMEEVAAITAALLEKRQGAPTLPFACSSQIAPRTACQATHLLTSCSMQFDNARRGRPFAHHRPPARGYRSISGPPGVCSSFCKPLHHISPPPPAYSLRPSSHRRRAPSFGTGRPHQPCPACNGSCACWGRSQPRTALGTPSCAAAAPAGRPAGAVRAPGRRPGARAVARGDVLRSIDDCTEGLLGVSRRCPAHQQGW